MWLATGLGTGWLWPAPGTWGSLLGLALFLLLLAGRGLVLQLVACLAVTAVGILVSRVAAHRLRSNDPSPVVIDEIAGMWVAALGTRGSVEWLLAFLLFRALDIVKPFPARRLEGLGQGVGIVADDVVAGLYARGALWLFLTAAG